MHHQRLYSCLQKRIKDWELFAKRGIGDIILNEVRRDTYTSRHRTRFD